MLCGLFLVQNGLSPSVRPRAVAGRVAIRFVSADSITNAIGSAIHTLRTNVYFAWMVFRYSVIDVICLRVKLRPHTGIS